MLSFTMHTILVLAVALFAALLQSSSAFVVSNNNCNLCTSYATQLLASPVAIPGTETETEEKREVYIPGEEKTPSTETGGAGNKGSGKSAFVLFYLVNACVQYKVSTSLLHVLTNDVIISSLHLHKL